LSNREGRFTWLLRKADDRTAARINSWALQDVHTMAEITRAYTHGTAGHGVLGCVDADNHGLSGIEYSCEQWLAGTAGRAVLRRDGLGRKYSIDPESVTEPVAGCRVELTLDVNWQAVLEDELAQGVKKYNALSGMGILLDCRTGEILAMADAFAGEECGSGRAAKCRVVTDVFEPGSSFKLVTFAAALAEGKLCPSDSFDAEMGKARFSNRFIRDDKKFGQLTIADAFRVSSNIVTGKMANTMGGDVVRHWAKNFGFGAQTKVMLSAEQSGSVPDHRWSDYVTAAFSIGHGVSVTTLQLANAYASLANGGLLMKPYLVKRVVDARGNLLLDRQPDVLRRVMPPDVAANLMAMARAVVSDGTATQVLDPDIPLGGKTGTAEKPDLENKRMIKNKYIASFAGFWPVNRPHIVGVIVLDEPEPIHYGGWTAAPILLNVFRRGSSARDRQPDRIPVMMASSTAVPTASDPPDSRTMTQGNEFSNDNQTSFWSLRRAHVPSLEGRPTDRVPDVTGLTAREAIAVLNNCGLKAGLIGAGRVFRQTPGAGSRCGQGELCQLRLR